MRTTSKNLFDSLAIACRFGHVDVAMMLLDRCIAADPELGRRIDRWKGRSATVQALASPWSIGGRYLGDPGHEVVPLTPWQAIVMHEVQATIDDDDLIAFRRWLDAESWLGDEAWVAAQVSIVERSAWMNREAAHRGALAAGAGAAPGPGSSAVGGDAVRLRVRQRPSGSAAASVLARSRRPPARSGTG